MPPKTKRQIMEELFSGIHEPWTEDKDYMLDKGTIASRKHTEVFDFVVYEIEPSRWVFDLVLNNGEVPYTTVFTVTGTNREFDLVEAQGLAMQEVFDLLNSGIATWGISYNLERPVDEIRLKQVFVEASSGKILGLSDDGVLHRFEGNKVGGTWVPTSMKREIKPRN